MPALPFSITLGRPSRGELLSLVGAAILVGSAASWVSTTSQPAPAPPEEPPPETAPLGISSAPPGADLLVDSQPHGTTPATLAVLPGRHEVVVQARSAIQGHRVVEVEPGGSSLDLSLWRARPTVTYLKPPLPGAMLTDAGFLADGRLALQVALPDGERQAWTLDPDGPRCNPAPGRRRGPRAAGGAD